MEKLIGLLFGAVFAVRALDAKKPWWARVAYGTVGFDLVSSALRGEPLADARPKGAQASKLVAGNDGTKLHFEEKRVGTIAERVSLVHEQMVKGTRDPQVYMLAREVLSQRCGDTWCAPEKDPRAELTALFNAVRKRVRYTWDPIDYDAFQTPAKTLQLGTADCDCYVALLGALCRSVNYRVRSRVVQTKGNTTWNHIYLLAAPNGTEQWMSLDPSMNMPAGWEVPKSYVIAMKDFDVVERGGNVKLNGG